MPSDEFLKQHATRLKTLTKRNLQKVLSQLQFGEPWAERVLSAVRNHKPIPPLIVCKANLRDNSGRPYTLFICEDAFFKTERCWNLLPFELVSLEDIIAYTDDGDPVRLGDTIGTSGSDFVSALAPGAPIVEMGERATG
jgi:hypothetical protein